MNAEIRGDLLEVEDADPRGERYCIIGAGPAGLGVARRFAAHGIPFDIIERHSDVGGIWDIENPGSPMYESAHFISSKGLSAYPGFAFPDHAAEYPSHREVLEYIRAYATHHGLRRRVEFGRHVVAVEPRQDRWLVRLRDAAPRSYRGVVLATGFQWVPNQPQWPGVETFQGTSLHSVAYRSPSIFDGKRVLIVGCGASAVDIANDAAQRASRTFLSVRRGHYFVPKHMFGRPTDVWAKGGPRLPIWLRQRIFARLLEALHGDWSRYGLPAPDYKIFERPPILDSRILDHLSHGRIRPRPDVAAIEPDGARFADGAREPVDVIVYCTGYRECWPLIDERHLRPTGDGDLALHMFHRRYDNLFVAGLLRINAGGFWLFEEQAELMARAIACPPAQRARLRATVAALGNKPRGDVRYQKNDYQSHYLDADTYVARLGALRKTMGWR